MEILKSNESWFRQYMESKNHAPSTQAGYLKYVELFLLWYKSDPLNCTKKDILDYLAYLKKHTKQQNASRRSSLTALNHYFNALIQAELINHNPVARIKMRGANRKQLYKIYTPEELIGLADNFYTLFVSGFDDSRLSETQKKKSFLSRHRNYAMLTFLLFQGLPTNEIPQININDIDLHKARLILKNRTLPIQAAQMGTLIH